MVYLCGFNPTALRKVKIVYNFGLPECNGVKMGFSPVQYLQEAIFQAQQSWQEARDRGQSRQKPNMTESLCRKQKLADSFIPCVDPH